MDDLEGNLTGLLDEVSSAGYDEVTSAESTALDSNVTLESQDDSQLYTLQYDLRFPSPPPKRNGGTRKKYSRKARYKPINQRSIHEKNIFLRKRIQKVKPSLDNSQPKTLKLSHLRNNVKRKKDQDQQLRNIIRSNDILHRKLNAIYKRQDDNSVYKLKPVRQKNSKRTSSLGIGNKYPSILPRIKQKSRLAEGSTWSRIRFEKSKYSAKRNNFLAFKVQEMKKINPVWNTEAISEEERKVVTTLNGVIKNSRNEWKDYLRSLRIPSDGKVRKGKKSLLGTDTDADRPQIVSWSNPQTYYEDFSYETKEYEVNSQVTSRISNISEPTFRESADEKGKNDWLLHSECMNIPIFYRKEQIGTALATVCILLVEFGRRMQIVVTCVDSEPVTTHKLSLNIEKMHDISNGDEGDSTESPHRKYIPPNSKDISNVLSKLWLEAVQPSEESGRTLCISTMGPNTE